MVDRALFAADFDATVTFQVINGGFVAIVVTINMPTHRVDNGVTETCKHADNSCDHRLEGTSDESAHELQLSNLLRSFNCFL